MNRPNYRNAQSRVMLEEMDDAFLKAENDINVRVIVLSGEGDHFSSGHDLGTPEELQDREKRGFPEDVKDFYGRARSIFFENTMRWRNIRKPTIAIVQGYCIFGGFMIASAMDIIFASTDALFLTGNSQYFTGPWELGARKTKEILFETRFISAKEARELGLVNRVFPRLKLEEESMKYASRVAEADPFTVQSSKFLVNNTLDIIGYTASLNSAFQTYFANRSLGWSDFEKKVSKTKKLADIEKAMNHLKIKENTDIL